MTADPDTVSKAEKIECLVEAIEQEIHTLFKSRTVEIQVLNDAITRALALDAASSDLSIGKCVEMIEALYKYQKETGMKLPPLKLLSKELEKYATSRQSGQISKAFDSDDYQSNLIRLQWFISMYNQETMAINKADKQLISDDQLHLAPNEHTEEALQAWTNLKTTQREQLNSIITNLKDTKDRLSDKHKEGLRDLYEKIDKIFTGPAVGGYCQDPMFIGAQGSKYFAGITASYNKIKEAIQLPEIPGADKCAWLWDFFAAVDVEAQSKLVDCKIFISVLIEDQETPLHRIIEECKIKLYDLYGAIKSSNAFTRMSEIADIYDEVVKLQITLPEIDGKKSIEDNKSQLDSIVSFLLDIFSVIEVEERALYLKLFATQKDNLCSNLSDAVKSKIYELYSAINNISRNNDKTYLDIKDGLSSINKLYQALSQSITLPSFPELYSMCTSAPSIERYPQTQLNVIKLFLLQIFKIIDKQETTTCLGLLKTQQDKVDTLSIEQQYKFYELYKLITHMLETNELSLTNYNNIKIVYTEVKKSSVALPLLENNIPRLNAIKLFISKMTTKS